MTSEKKSSGTLPIKTMEDIVAETVTYIERRRSGEETSLKVASKRINDTFMDGFDWGRIVTIAGLSGSGKSTLLRQ